MDWGVVDERLIRRGELLLSLDFLESYDLELSVLNCGKVGYDTGNSYILLGGMGVRPIIKPRANARTDRGPPERRASAAILKMFGERGWSMFMGYGRRWAVETALSTYKRPYGEHTMSRNIENIERELKTKAYIYNTLINMHAR
jgi:hypothetical protein